jgi:hypothetical protein
MVHMKCGDLDDHLMSTRNFLLIPNKVFIWSFKNYKVSGYNLDVDVLAMNISYEKCTSWKKEKKKKKNHFKTQDCGVAM